MTDAPKIIQMENGVWRLEGEQLWDTDLLPIILEHINPGDTVIDAGAWIGGHTMAYAEKVGKSGRVWSFEPNKFAFDCLLENTSPFRNVRCLPFALGDKLEHVPFSTKKGWLDSGYVGQSDNGAHINMMPLDYTDFSPSFIKIDVEGCELKVLKGASKTIEEHKPIMVIEVNEPALKRQGNTRSEILYWLGYHAYSADIIENNATWSTDIYNVICKPL